MGLKGVVFDFNGTLFWDTDLHNRAWDIFLKKHGIGLSDKDKYEKLHGKNNREILNGIFPGQFPADELEKLSLEKEKIYQELCLQTDMHLAPGAEEYLHFLMKVPISFTLATASTLFNLDFYFHHLGLETFFDRSKVIFNDGHTLSKPHPHIFQKAMDLLGLKAEETLVFEDSVSGITAAENAGVAKIIIVDSYGDDYSRWSYQKIKNFKEVDRNLFHHSSLN
jgi:HAD superfamily hydrolase (TIGR01509 family)